MKIPLSILLVWPAVALGAGALPEYPGAQLVTVSGALAVAGQPLRLGYFTTHDAVAVVARYFFQRFVSEGYPATWDGNGPKEAIVCAFDTRQRTQVAVVLRHQDGRTLGFSTIKDFRMASAAIHPVLVQLERTLLDESSENPQQRIRTSVAEMGYAEASRAITEQLSSSRFSALMRMGTTTSEWKRIRGNERIRVVLTELSPSWVAITESREQVRP